MSPERAGTLAALARLRREIAADRSAMARRAAEAESVRQLDPRGPADLALGALAMHSWYTGLEGALERIAREIDGSVPRGDRWHQSLLSAALTEIPHVRPPILTPDLERGLVELLGFRHFVRHAYGADLDPVKLAGALEQLAALAPGVDAALDAFDAFLAASMAAASGTDT